MEKQELDVFSNKFSYDIFKQKYSLNGQESWSECCRRVVSAVCGQHLSHEDQEIVYDYMIDRKFIPGGRYLASAGKAVHQINNCFLFRAEDSRESWADSMYKATSCLMLGGGIGFDYSALRAEGEIIKRTGGTSTGPIALMHMINEAGRFIMMGGQRRSAIWAGLSWNHGDVKKFLRLKDWNDDLIAMKQKDLTFSLPMEGTNISVIYDTEFFVAIENRKHELHKWAKEVWKENCLQAFKTAEPGFSFNFLKDNESLRNACVTGDTCVLIKGKNGKPVNRRIRSLVGKRVEAWNGWEWSEVEPKITGTNQPILKITTNKGKVLKCTHYHKFILDDDFDERVNAIDLNIYSRLYDVDRQAGIKHTIEKIEDAGIADTVYCFNEPKRHTAIFNGILTGQCTEVVSEDDSDKCNLGTIWINRFDDRDDFARCCKYATMFLICGGIYSDVPTDKIREIGVANNRIGLGLGGIHEWLLVREMPYSVTPELHKWLNIYEHESDAAAFIFSREIGVNKPKGIRAIAPNGTIGILAETTTGIEPLFCKAYKRRYLKGKDWHYQYVVDGVVKRLLDIGTHVDNIQDAYDISFKDRVKFQADVSNYIDMNTSSTCNMPAWGTELNDESTVDKYSKILLKYAKRLRGFTCYPDGCRTGQPLTRIDLKTALDNEGTVFEEREAECVGGVCGV